MYASVTTVPVKPDAWDDLASLYAKLLQAYVGGPEGLKAGYLLRVPGTEIGMSLAFYETESQARDSAEPGGLFSKVAPQLAHCFAGPPERAIH